MTRRTVLTLPGEFREILENRGAQAHRGPFPGNFSDHVRRMFSLYEWLIAESDPRKTMGMSDADYQLVVEAIMEPETIPSIHVRRLGDFLLHHPPFLTLAKQRSRDPLSLCSTLDQYPYAENLHLLDAARRRAAPLAILAPPLAAKSRASGTATQKQKPARRRTRP